VQTRIRTTDVLAPRGDEFGVLLSDCTLDTRAALPRTAQAIRDFRFLWATRDERRRLDRHREINGARNHWPR